MADPTIEEDRATAPRCSDCRFWNRNGNPWERRSRDGDPGHEWLEPVPTEKQKCLRVLHANGGQGEADDDPAIVTDGSGFAAAFWTEPSFGCTSFEPIDAVGVEKPR